MSARALVMRVTGSTVMMGLLYDFVGRSVQAEQEEREELRKVKEKVGSKRIGPVA
jgi:hypothetical protein